MCFRILWSKLFVFVFFLRVKCRLFLFIVFLIFVEELMFVLIEFILFIRVLFVYIFLFWMVWSMGILGRVWFNGFVDVLFFVVVFVLMFWLVLIVVKWFIVENEYSCYFLFVVLVNCNVVSWGNLFFCLKLVYIFLNLLLLIW